MGDRQKPHRTTTSFSIDKDLLEQLNEEVRLRTKAGEETDRSKIVQEALVDYLDLSVTETTIEVPGPPVYKRKVRRGAKKKRS